MDLLPQIIEVLFEDNEPNDKKWKLWLEKMLVGRDGCLAGQWQLRVQARARTPASELTPGRQLAPDSPGHWAARARHWRSRGPMTVSPIVGSSVQCSGL